MGYRMMRPTNRFGAKTAIATIKRPGISFIDLIFWLVGLVFGGFQTKGKYR